MKKDVCCWIIAFFNCTLLVAQTPNWLWVKDATSGNNEIAWDVSCDMNTGDVYIGGSFEGGLSSVFGSSFLNVFGQKDGYLTKYSPTGTIIWANKIGGSNEDEIKGVATDPSGNVYVTGTFKGIIDADPSASDFTLTANGGIDGYLAKYNSAGQFIWAVKLGGTNDEDVWRIFADGNAVYITGSYRSSATFYSTNSTTKNTAANQAGENFFGAKYNSAGICTWVVTAGSDKDDSGHDVVADNNRVYFLGDYKNNLTVYDGSGTQCNVMPIQSNDKTDVFILAIDPSGSFAWITNASSPDQETGNGITQDANNIYITGSFKDDAVFPYPSATFTQNCQGGTDIFVAAISKTTGNYQWVSSQTGSANGDEMPYEIDCDGNGNVVVAGYFKSSLNFSSYGGPNLNSSGNEDIFITGFNTSGNFQWAKKAGDNGRDIPHGLSLYNGDVYFSGEYEDNAAFGSIVLSNGGGKNIFVGRTGCTQISNNTISGSQTVCVGTQPAGIAGSVPVGTSSSFTYLWEQSSDGNFWIQASGNYTTQNYSPPQLSSDVYYRRKIVTSQNCGPVPISNITSVKYTPLPSQAFAGENNTVCSASINLNAQLPVTGSGKWTLVQGNASIVSINSNSTLISNLPQGKSVFRWTVSNGACPSSSDDVEIIRDAATDIAYAGPDLTVDLPVFQLSANTPSAGTGTWSILEGDVTFSNINDPKAKITLIAEGQNRLRWTLKNGSCPDNSDDISIYLSPLEFPNAFSPNGDNINDAFTIPSLDRYENVRFYVYNRWGSLVYYNDNYRNNWRGSNMDNARLADDTYYYTLEIPSKTNYTGFIVLKHEK
ncbi:MAG: hypothetical protein K0S32_3206 [Bacteroidetes bacterium]|jgi:gliding motility-associated-like protein|nr:hypothetical protein [Bacteroidota bacterium]